MKKLIGVFALCLTSSLVFADEAAVKMVLDRVHEKSFSGCDNEIREAYKSEYSVVRHVEVRVPLAINEQGDYSKSVDEVIVVVDGNPIVGAESDLNVVNESLLFRNIGKRCVSAYISRAIFSSNRDCNAMAKWIGKTGEVAKTGNTVWVGYGGKYSPGAENLLTSLPRGGCWATDLPDDRFRSYKSRN